MTSVDRGKATILGGDLKKLGICGLPGNEELILDLQNSLSGSFTHIDNTNQVREEFELTDSTFTQNQEMVNYIFQP